MQEACACSMMTWGVEPLSTSWLAHGCIRITTSQQENGIVHAEAAGCLTWLSAGMSGISKSEPGGVSGSISAPARMSCGGLWVAPCASDVENGELLSIPAAESQSLRDMHHHSAYCVIWNHLCCPPSRVGRDIYVWRYRIWLARQSIKCKSSNGLRIALEVSLAYDMSNSTAAGEFNGYCMWQAMHVRKGSLTILECVLIGNGSAGWVIYAHRALLQRDALHSRRSAGADLGHAKLAGQVAARHKSPWHG